MSGHGLPTLQGPDRGDQERPAGPGGARPPPGLTRASPPSARDPGRLSGSSLGHTDNPQAPGLLRGRPLTGNTAARHRPIQKSRRGANSIQEEENDKTRGTVSHSPGKRSHRPRRKRRTCHKKECSENRKLPWELKKPTVTDLIKSCRREASVSQKEVGGREGETEEKGRQEPRGGTRAEDIRRQ